MRSARLGAWACIASGVVALGWSVHPLPLPTLSPALGRSPTPVFQSPPDTVGGLPHAITSRNLFRAARQPAATAYDPQTAIAPAVVASAVPKPTLTLVGVIAGRDPTAVVDGFPGVEGSRVVRIGDVVGGLTVRTIASGAVRITGMDTVWVLKVRELR